MNNSIKMSDVFGDGFSLWNESGFINDGESDLGSLSCNSFTDAAVIAINSYDANQELITKQAEQIKILRTALEAVAKVNHTHGGSLGFSGHFYYKVSENVFKLCDKALEATRPVEE